MNLEIFGPSLIALSIVVLLFSVIVHEVMHGLAALKFGDHTAQRAGRLTLNPIPHIDPVGTILLPALLFISGSPILFGWAKPVPVNPLNFSSLRKGELLVSAAGILSNLGLAIIAALLFHLLRGLSLPFIVLELLDFMININLLLAVFNLIPIPPLDGSKILLSQLPYNLAREYQKLEQYGFILLLLLWFIPIGNSSLLGFILLNGTSILKSLLGF
ncbi:site-2 protease family protein [Candidatus Daviesbacteria bacterium]|nr:site-2 protease family protein [Candidatus Daviesbacteria bacterium]